MHLSHNRQYISIVRCFLSLICTSQRTHTISVIRISHENWCRPSYKVSVVLSSFSKNPKYKISQMCVWWNSHFSMWTDMTWIVVAFHVVWSSRAIPTWLCCNIVGYSTCDCSCKLSVLYWTVILGGFQILILARTYGFAALKMLYNVSSSSW
jgi:hypothetical protein